MPELPEVETVARRLHGATAGRTVASVTAYRADIVRPRPSALARRLRGLEVEEVARHGKRLLWRFENGVVLNVHLGMTGNLELAHRRATRAPHTHVVFRFRDDGREVRFRDPRRFGGLWLEGSAPGSGRFSTVLGPDALAIDLDGFRALMARDRQVKALLLDQTAIAGIGNIYADEALHRARIHPAIPASRVSDGKVQRLRSEIRAILGDAIAAGGSTLRDYRGADGEPGWFQVEHRVYAREGEPCLRCGGGVRRIVLASRSTHLCPRCQRAPRPRGGTPRGSRSPD